MDRENTTTIVFPTGTVVKSVPLSELEQQIPNIAKYQVVEISFPSDAEKKELGLDALGAVQKKAEIAQVGQEFIGALSGRLVQIGVLQPIQQPQNSSNVAEIP